MTNFLIKTFIKNYNNTAQNEVRTAYGKLSGGVGIVCNLLLFAFKLAVGLFSGSVSVTADAVNNLSDASSGIINLLGFKMASRPADEDHPYGHARYEYLSGLMVAVLIMIIGFELLKSSLGKIFSPTPVTFSIVTVVVLVLSILVKLWLMTFNTHVGKLIDSQALITTAADSRNDVISTGAVILAAILSHFLHVELDGYVGVCVAAFILYSGFGLIRETLDPILGKAPKPEFVEEIRKKIMSYPAVLGTHDLMIHDYGPGHQFASVHVEVAAEGDILETHDVIDNIERAFMQEYGLHMVIHMDPIVTADETVGNVRLALSKRVADIDPQLTIHDLRMVPGPTHTNLVFDCVVPHGFSMPNAELRKRISDAAKELDPKYNCVITVENNFAFSPKN